MCNAIRFQQGEPHTGLSQRDEHVSLSLSLSQLGQCDITHTWCTTVSYHSQQCPLTDRGQNDPNTPTKTAFTHAHSGDGDLLASVSSGSSGGSSTSSPLLSSSTNGSCDGMTGSCTEKKTRWYGQGIFQMSVSPLLFETPNQNLTYPNMKPKPIYFLNKGP